MKGERNIDKIKRLEKLNRQAVRRIAELEGKLEGCQEDLNRYADRNLALIRANEDLREQAEQADELSRMLSRSMDGVLCVLAEKYGETCPNGYRLEIPVPKTEELLSRWSVRAENRDDIAVITLVANPSSEE